MGRNRGQRNKQSGNANDKPPTKQQKKENSNAKVEQSDKKLNDDNSQNAETNPSASETPEANLNATNQAVSGANTSGNSEEKSVKTKLQAKSKTTKVSKSKDDNKPQDMKKENVSPKKTSTQSKKKTESKTPVSQQRKPEESTQPKKSDVKSSPRVRHRPLSSLNAAELSQCDDFDALKNIPMNATREQVMRAAKKVASLSKLFDDGSDLQKARELETALGELQVQRASSTAKEKESNNSKSLEQTLLGLVKTFADVEKQREYREKRLLRESFAPKNESPSVPREEKRVILDPTENLKSKLQKSSSASDVLEALGVVLAIDDNEGSAEIRPEVGSCGVCEKEAEQRCTGCRKVFYCSRQCQKVDWQTHKLICRPYTVEKNEELGRYLVAARDLQPDEIIVQEDPLVFGPRQVTEPVCLGCYRRIDGSYRCSKCTWPMCSAICEGALAHAVECQVTRAAALTLPSEASDTPHHMYEVVTALRCLMAAQKDSKKWRSTTEKLNNPYLASPNSEIYIENQERVAKILVSICKAANLPGLNPSFHSVHQVLGLLSCSGVPIKMAYGEVLGLFPVSSQVSHSCVPNTKSSWEDNQRLVLKATEPIAKGKPITAMYADILLGTKARRDHVLETRMFHCKCRRCADPTELGTNFSSLRCPKCPKGPAIRPIDPIASSTKWKCISCDLTMSADRVLQISRDLGAMVEKNLYDPNVEKLEKLMNEWKPKVHSNHYHLHAVKHSLLQLYARGKETWDEKDDKYWEEINKKEKICKDFLSVCSKLDPSIANTIPYVGVTFFEYHKTIHQLAKRNFALAQLTSEQMKKRLQLAKALLKKTMEIFKNEAEDTPEGQLYMTAQQEVISIGKWMLATGLV